ncbi:hypothetical protein DTO212C5_9035 [Paecilomyces variotii]|nr:hypothetical protein DTO212C5_9035 [Paecilomyces variotii]
MNAFTLLVALAGSSFARPQFAASPVGTSALNTHPSPFSAVPHSTSSHTSLSFHTTFSTSSTLHASPSVHVSVHPSSPHVSTSTTAIPRPTTAPEAPAACPNPFRETSSPAPGVSHTTRVSSSSAHPTVTVTVPAACPAAPAPATITVTECPAASVHASSPVSHPSVAATSPHIASSVSHPASAPSISHTSSHPASAPSISHTFSHPTSIPGIGHTSSIHTTARISTSTVHVVQATSSSFHMSPTTRSPTVSPRVTGSPTPI